MALRYGFFNSVGGDRKYDARWFAKYFATFIGNGIFPNPSNGFQVFEHENMTVAVKAGQGWINGYYADNDADYYLILDNADGLLSRIDRIVLRWNQIDRVIELAVKKGTFASNPVAPALQRDGDFYELGLADILISNGSTQITQGAITDLRLNNEFCGIVHSLVNQVDTTTIFNQYQAWFNGIKDGVEEEIFEWTQQQQQNFTDWLATIQNILDGDIAANLAQRIATLSQQYESLNNLIEENTHKINHVVVDMRDMIKIKRNVMIYMTSWQEVNGNEFMYDLNDDDITESSIVDINIHLSSLDDASVLKSANISYEGKVTLFANAIPTNDLICDLKIVKESEVM